MGCKRVFLSGFAVAIALSASSLFAQGGPGQRGGFGGGMFGNNNLMLLTNPSVQKELDIVDSQMKDLEDLQADIRSTMTELFEEMRGGDGGDRQQMFEKMRTKMEGKMKDMEADLGEILAPDQLRRLKQLGIQQQSRGRGGAGTGLLDNDQLKKDLGITEDQEAKMREEAEKAQEELRKETAKLQQKALDRVLSVLSAEQRSQYKEMVGDPFDFGAGGGMFGGQGGRGGQGGGRGQDGGRGGQGGGRGGRTDF